LGRKHYWDEAGKDEGGAKGRGEGEKGRHGEGENGEKTFNAELSTPTFSEDRDTNGRDNLKCKIVQGRGNPERGTEDAFAA
jgi:hypothetical protein